MILSGGYKTNRTWDYGSLTGYVRGTHQWLQTKCPVPHLQELNIALTRLPEWASEKESDFVLKPVTSGWRDKGHRGGCAGQTAKHRYQNFQNTGSKIPEPPAIKDRKWKKWLLEALKKKNLPVAKETPKQAAPPPGKNCSAKTSASSGHHTSYHCSWNKTCCG